MNVKEYLHENDVAFDVIEHLPVYDAGRLAEAVHVSGREVAKTVLLKSSIGDTFLVAVLPANRTIHQQPHCLRVLKSPGRLEIVVAPCGRGRQGAASHEHGHQSEEVAEQAVGYIEHPRHLASGDGHARGDGRLAVDLER